jgi:trans-aconitate 2-methyltransferase
MGRGTGKHAGPVAPDCTLQRMSEWDASRYHRISGPQFDWGQRVIARLGPAPGERILDLGCGTGRLTQEILAMTPEGRVFGIDRSGAMIAVAREAVDPDARVRPA